MKKIILFTAFISLTAVLTAFTTRTKNSTKTEFTLASDYCDGWEVGYCEGWKDVNGQYAICPITPICPIPEIGKDDYSSGYNRGFKAGRNAAKND